MKSLVQILVTLLVISSAATAYDPPKGLSWGMSLSDVKETFAFSADEEKPKIEKVFALGKWDQFFYPKDMIDKNEQMKLARLQNVTLLGKKVKEAYLILDTTDHLIGFQYQIMPFDEKQYQKCWEQYQKYSEVLREKYGTPTRNDVTSAVLGTDLVEGTHYDCIWKDTVSGGQIVLTFTLDHWGSGLLKMTQYMVIIRYECRNLGTGGQEKLKKDDF